LITQARCPCGCTAKAQFVHGEESLKRYAEVFRVPHWAIEDEVRLKLLGELKGQCKKAHGYKKEDLKLKDVSP